MSNNLMINEAASDLAAAFAAVRPVRVRSVFDRPMDPRGYTATGTALRGTGVFAGLPIDGKPARHDQMSKLELITTSGTEHRPRKIPL